VPVFATGGRAGTLGTQNQAGPETMLQLLILLIVVAVVAGALGFTGVAAGAATAAKIVFGLMLIGIVIVLVLAATGLALLF
jgi:uncharacterized membrane protein YtjA (UPF0391 family)